MNLSKRRRFVIPLAIFAVVYVMHFFSGVIASGDSRWSIHTAQSILQEGNADLDEYAQDLFDNDYYWVERIDGHYYTRFPLGASLIALPFVFVMDHALKAALAAFPRLGPYLLAHSVKPLTSISVTTIYWRIELVTACFVIALTTVIIYGMVRETLSDKTSALAAFILAFCTSAWSTGSRSMGQHGPSMLILAIALYFFVVARRRPAAIQYAGLPLAFAYVVRPTNSIPIAMLTLVVLVSNRRYFLRYLLWTLPVLMPFFAYNLHIYHALTSKYYRPEQLGTTTHFFEALAGTLVSPSRGLLVYTPVFLAAIAGYGIRLRTKTAGALDHALAATVLLHWIAISSFDDWWGGHSYGPRYFSDLTPVFIYFLMPVLAKFSESGHTARPALRWGFAVLVAISFFIHARGATDLRTWVWNREPVDVNDAPGRLWDWRDPQFLRDLFT